MTVTTLNILMDCSGAHRAGCVQRRRQDPRRRTGARVLLAALGLAALAAGLYGERWLLRDAPLREFEYVAATCAALAVENAQPSNVCASSEIAFEGKIHE